MSYETDLTALVSETVDSRKFVIHISPIAIANECMEALDPDKTSVPQVYAGCHLHLRQIARAMLARAYDPADKKKRDRDALAAGDLFTLQARYPMAHSADLEEPVYVRRDDMTEEDVKYNIARLRSEGRAKLRHADALQAWWNERFPPDAPAEAA